MRRIPPYIATPPLNVERGGEILVGRNGPLLSTPPMTVDYGGVRNPCKKTQGQAEADSALQTTHTFRRIPQPLQKDTRAGVLAGLLTARGC